MFSGTKRRAYNHEPKLTISTKIPPQVHRELNAAMPKRGFSTVRSAPILSRIWAAALRRTLRII